MSYSKEDLRDLYDGKLPWNKTFEIMSKPKDNDRFDKYVEILQERVSYSEKILMPLGDHLNVVQKNAERVVKCDCGHEFGDWRQNWKLGALIFSRDDAEKLEEISRETGVTEILNLPATDVFKIRAQFDL